MVESLILSSALLVVVAWCAWVIVRAVRQRPASVFVPRCRACRYPIVEGSTSGRCPECGAHTEGSGTIPPGEGTRSPPHRLTIWIAAFLLTALVAELSNSLVDRWLPREDIVQINTRSDYFPSYSFRDGRTDPVSPRDASRPEYRPTLVFEATGSRRRPPISGTLTISIAGLRADPRSVRFDVVTRRVKASEILTVQIGASSVDEIVTMLYADAGLDDSNEHIKKQANHFSAIVSSYLLRPMASTWPRPEEQCADWTAGGCLTQGNAVMGMAPRQECREFRGGLIDSRMFGLGLFLIQIAILLTIGFVVMHFYRRARAAEARDTH